MTRTRSRTLCPSHNHNAILHMTTGEVELTAIPRRRCTKNESVRVLLRNRALGTSSLEISYNYPFATFPKLWSFT